MTLSRRWARLRREEVGITLIEMLIVMLLMGILMVGLVNVFVSGTHAQYDLSTRLNAQEDARTALSRLEYEGRCASSATILSAGTGVSFSLPAQCVHGTGTVTWCVTSGALTRYTATSCTGAAMVFVRDISSATPFTLQTTSGYLPRLAINLVATPAGLTVDRFTASDTITLRNSAPTP